MPTEKQDAKISLANPLRASKKSDAEKIKGLLGVAGLLGVGLLLHQLPSRVPADGFKTILPADWKVWARVILGIAAVQKLNRTLDWKPPPWLGALEAISIINPVAAGFSVANALQTIIMAPIVAGVVQGAHTLHNKIAEPIEQNYGVAPVFTRLGVSLLLGVGAILAYPKAFKVIVESRGYKALVNRIPSAKLKERILEASATSVAASASGGAMFATCARGCSPGSFICLSEMADIVGSFTTWFNSSNSNCSGSSQASHHTNKLFSPAVPADLFQRQKAQIPPFTMSTN
ncbi:MAG: hypothetical protein VKJ04_03655 [Vampirovibrionales bacterium]|nr:hypothetical protein [Vampirovibrionales bacterium]